jgi:hypothetical protein
MKLKTSSIYMLKERKNSIEQKPINKISVHHTEKEAFYKRTILGRAFVPCYHSESNIW